MSNLPENMRKDIAAEIPVITEETHLVSKKDGSIKFLMKMPDGQMIETVFMRYHHGNSVCISSQAGCRMGCRFCASTIGGLVRNLEPSEMLYQIYHAIRSTGERVSNIVVMGTGEPLDNYDNLIRFLDLITDENGYNISERNITVSSCGLVPMIKKLADEKQLTKIGMAELVAAGLTNGKKLVKILGNGKLTAKLDVEANAFSKTAEEAIKAAGGNATKI